MYKNPASLFKYCIEPNFAELESARPTFNKFSLQRKVINVVLSLNHLLDHFYSWYSKNDPSRLRKTTKFQEFRDEIEAEEPSVKIVRKFANAHKHPDSCQPERNDHYL